MGAPERAAELRLCSQTFPRPLLLQLHLLGSAQRLGLPRPSFPSTRPAASHSGSSSLRFKRGPALVEAKPSASALSAALIPLLRVPLIALRFLNPPHGACAFSQHGLSAPIHPAAPPSRVCSMWLQHAAAWPGCLHKGWGAEGPRLGCRAKQSCTPRGTLKTSQQHFYPQPIQGGSSHPGRRLLGKGSA